MMKIGSLFSGVAMLDVAVSVVFDAEVAWHSEINPAAVKVLKHQCPDVPNLGDITEIDWTQVEPVDILCGGFPCQDVSCAGRRAGLGEGTRSGLWSHFANAIAVLRPPIVVIENVRGLLSAKAKREDKRGEEEADGDVVGTGEADLAPPDALRAAGAVLGDLADLGYDAQWTTLAAATVGAPHKRERVFILATRREHDCAGCDGLCECHQPADPADVRLGGAADARGEGGEGLRAGPEGRGGARGAAAADDEGHGRDEGRSEPTGVERGPNAALGGAGPLDLLPTPVVNDMGDNKTVEWWDDFVERSKAKGVNGNGHGRSLSVEVRKESLLPTPGASDGSGGRSPATSGGTRESGAKRSVPLTDLPLLLPTPMAGDAKSARNSTAHRNKLPPTGVHAGDTLTDALWKMKADAGEFDIPTGPMRNAPNNLLPTPQKQDGDRDGGMRSQEAIDSGRHQVNLADLPRLLPTPRSADANGGGHYEDGRPQDMLQGALVEEVSLLPTPMARDHKQASPADMERHSPNMSAIAALLPTPSASLGEHRRDNGMDPEKRRAAGKQVSLADELCFLPTPQSRDWKEGMSGQRDLNDAVLREDVELLPTPASVDGRRGVGHLRSEHGADLVTSVAHHTETVSEEECVSDQNVNWGKYEAAVRRWEGVTRSAPPPTEPNSKGNPRLAPAFAEWMMGWPEGWVTDPAIGLSRNDQLKAIGNGVVPQQAIAALRSLLPHAGIKVGE